jgi:hypothetical protein
MAGEQQQLSNVARCLRSQKAAAVLRECREEESELGLFWAYELWKEGQSALAAVHQESATAAPSFDRYTSTSINNKDNVRGSWWKIQRNKLCYGISGGVEMSSEGPFKLQKRPAESRLLEEGSQSDAGKKPTTTRKKL